MSAHDQILEWANGQPAWRRDALRRLLIGAFGANDERDVLELLKASANLAETAIEPRPLTAEHLPARASNTDSLTLLSLGNITHANRLAPDQKLSFGPNGITLIYGDNGAGKSGYARILKKACRARSVEVILDNVFDPPTLRGPATAEIEIIAGGVRTPIKWEDGQPSPAELSQIAVFDSKCGSIYIDKDNEVTLIPYDLDCFERLARLCDKLRDILSAEYRALAASASVPVVVLSEGTAAAEFLKSLASKTDEQVTAATAWTESDQLRLDGLTRLVADPEARAISLRQAHADLTQLRRLIADIAPHLSEASLAALSTKRAALISAQQASALAATEAFSKEPLPGAGGSPWRSLYDAARLYAEQEAYRGKVFPPLDPDARCVLCQQTLSDQARDRMRRFEEFVRGEATRRADAARQTWEEAVSAFRSGTAGLTPMSPSFGQALKSEHGELHAIIMSYIAGAIKAHDQIERWILTGADAVALEMPTISLADIDLCLANMAHAATLAEGAASSEAAADLRQELAELKARNQLHLNKKQVIARLEALRTLTKLEGAIKACVTTGISQKGTELLREHVTAAFEAALTAECKALGVQIPLRLSSRSAKGTPTHQLKLDQTAFSGNTSEILSEGEHRAIALAAFLAEQMTVPGNAPIVIDDPVSSLDHERRHRVAHRLIEEGKKRQVIVFTHDLLLYVDASSIAAEKQVPLTKIGVRRGPHGFGTIDPEGDPWAAKTLPRRRDWLVRQLTTLQRMGDTAGGTDDYEKEARFFYDRLRETWERLIEEGLFASVIVRYRRSVETKRLKEAVIDDDMVSRIYSAMSSISEYTAHDKPLAAGPLLADPTIAKQHLDDLTACIDLVKDQSKSVARRREKFEKPPAAAMGSTEAAVSIRPLAPRSQSTA